MRRILNFVLGFILGAALSATIVMLATPQSAQTMRTLFNDAYEKRKTDLEAALDIDTSK